MFKGKIMLWFWRIFLFLIFGIFGLLKLQGFTFFDNALNTIYYHLNLDSFLTFQAFLMILGSIEIFLGIFFLWVPKTFNLTITIIAVIYMILFTAPIVFNFSDKSVIFMSQFDAFWEKFFYVLEMVLTSIWGIFLLDSKK